MSIELITIALFAAMFLVLVAGLPVAFVLGGVAMLFTLVLWGPSGLGIAAYATWGNMSAFLLTAIPMFIFMGNMLERSGIGDDLYEAMYRWMGPLKGGLAMGTVLICTVIAAMVGMVGPGTIMMGLIALPSMLRRGYNKHIAIGSVMGGGALGVLIPPSIPMIVYALIARESVGQMFLGGVFPGLLLSGLMIAYIGVRSTREAAMGPPVPPEERATWREKFVFLRSVIIPVVLILLVLGTIFMGIATPTEAAAVGALGTVISAAIYRRLNWQTLKEALYGTVRISGMVMWILIGATCFTNLYLGLGASQLVQNMVGGLEAGRWTIMIIMQLTLFLLGMIMDDFAIMLITAPLYVPIIKALGFDSLWFGIVFMVNMQLALLTPPYGFSLFYMKSIVPQGTTMGDIYRAAVPLLLIKATGLALVMAFPQIALWLPRLVFQMK